MDDERVDDALRRRMSSLATNPAAEPALQIFRAERARRRRRRRVIGAAASLAAIALLVIGVTAALDRGGEESIGVVTDPGETTDPAVATALPDVLGRDYRDATATLQDAGFPRGDGHIRWSIDIVTPGRFGEVLGMSPPVGETPADGQDIILRVAASERELGLGTDGAPPTLVGATWRDDPVPGLVPGIIDGRPSAECAAPVYGQTPGTVRFLNGEIVGCMLRGVVWLDQLELALGEVARMPDLVGLTPADASAELARAAPTADVDFGSMIGVSPQEPGVVIVSTAPAAGQAIVRGSGGHVEMARLLDRDAEAVRVYFTPGDSALCRSSAATWRYPVDGQDAIEAAFRGLFGGIVADDASYLPPATTWFPSNPDALRSVDLRDGLLTVDVVELRGWLGGNASTACGSDTFLSAIRATAFQFAGVDAVRLAQEGSCEDATAFFEGSGCTTYTREDWLAHR